ncbi:MAG: amidohydrolase family protein [Planctomycetota bacterium]
MLRVGHVLPVNPAGAWQIDDAVVIVRDGKIEQIGPADTTTIPTDLEVIAEPDAWLVPGFVAADTRFGGAHAGDESVAAGYYAIDAFDRYGDFARSLAAGVTTVHLNPGWHRLLSGQGAIVKLGGTPAERVLRSHADFCINLGVYGPPRDVTFSFPASSDVAIEAPIVQRPASRLGQFLGLTEALAASRGASINDEFSWHRAALRAGWDAKLPLRITAERAADILGAKSFLIANERAGYLVGGLEAARVAASLEREKIPLVYRPGDSFMAGGADFGSSPEALATHYDLLSLHKNIPLAFAPPTTSGVRELRLVAAQAHAAGVSELRALSGITRTAAEILGVSDRVGSLAPGLDADFLLMTAHPLDIASHVAQTFVGGTRVYQAPESTALIVRGERIWVRPGQEIEQGELLIENGRIVAVGRAVPHPPHARVIDGGPGSYITPGFIDGFGHLGFGGDANATNPEDDLSGLVGAASAAELRVAHAGVTTQLVGPRRFSARGSRLMAMKTSGVRRAERVLKPTAAIAFDVRGTDPRTIGETLRRRLEAGKKYIASWEKYEQELAAYRAKEAKGEATPATKKVEEVVEQKADLISGTWEGTATGAPLPAPQRGKVVLRLEGKEIEGRVIEPPVPFEHRILLTLNDRQLKGHIEVDTGGRGNPTVEAEFVGDEQIKGSVALLGFQVQFEMRRIDKATVEFKVTRRLATKSGRPEPPTIDESLEPLRALLRKEIPALIAANSAAEIREVLKVLVTEHQLPVVLIEAQEADVLAAQLVEQQVGVVLPRFPVTERRETEYHHGDTLQRHGVRIAFQSAAEDGARALPFQVLFAIERGLSAEAALAALTSDAAALYRVSDRIGTLELGKDADLVIFAGHPFQRGSKVERVLVNGKEARE